MKIRFWLAFALLCFGWQPCGRVAEQALWTIGQPDEMSIEAISSRR